MMGLVQYLQTATRTLTAVLPLWPFSDVARVALLPPHSPSYSLPLSQSI